MILFYSIYPVYKLIANYNGEIIQEHGQKKGDDLLASVRIIGRYDVLLLLSFELFFTLTLDGLPMIYFKSYLKDIFYILVWHLLS